MPSLNKTSELGLNQWSGSDYPKRDDFNNDNLIVDNAIKDLRKRIAGSLSDLNALKALDTTGMADNILIAVKALGIYRLDKTSILAANDTSVIQPAKGTGRWINILYDANNYTDIKTDAIMDILRKGAVINPPINFGMNNKITIPEGGTSVQPKFTFQGKHSINLLGKDGNCEDVSKWTINGSTLALDSNNKMFGNNAIKIISTGSHVYSTMYKPKTSINIDASQYYLFSGYLKNGNADNGIKLFVEKTSGIPDLSTDYITDSTKFARVGIKLSPSDIANIANFHAYCGVTTGANQYGYADGMMLNKITADDYNNLTVDQLMAEYPYHDSYSCLRNPYIEILHDNLIRNGNGEEGIAWWKPVYSDDMIVVNPSGWTTITTAHVYGGYYQQAKLKKNTDYYINGVIDSNGRIAVYQGIPSTGGTWVTNANYHFNTGNNEDFYIALQKVTAGSFSFSKIMLIEGTTAPREYKPCKIERVVLEGKLADGDTLTYQAGKAEGQINWGHKTLYGKDYDFVQVNYTGGYKIVTSTFPKENQNNTNFTSVVKYDGSITVPSGTITAGNQNSLYDGTLYLSLLNSDTGFVDSIQPNSNELKAFMNGWRAVWNNGTRYVAWTSILDNSMPLGATYTSSYSVASAGQNKLVTNNGSLFAAEDMAIYRRTDGYWECNTITEISGNELTFANNITVGVTVNALVWKADNGTTNTSLLNWCVNNVAPSYEGYQLHYKLQNPKPITDINCHVHGDILSFDLGDNYVYMDAGRIINEVANIQTDGGGYCINTYTAGGVYRNSILQNKTEFIETIYKDAQWNNSVWTFRNSYMINSYGNQDVYTSPVTNVNPKATYTVDYKILATMAPQIGSMSCQYNTAVFEAINELEKAVNNRQVHDSALDDLIDKSMYEVINGGTGRFYTKACLYWDGSAIAYVYLNIVPKKSIPVISIDWWDSTSFIYMTSSGGGGPTIPLSDMNIVPFIIGSTLGLFLQYRGSDSAIKTNIQNYGIGIAFNKITLDCR